MKNNSEIEIYQSPDGNTEVQVTFDNDTVWLSLTQMAELFGRDKSVVSRHLRNIYKEGELEKAATIAKNATVQIEGQREIKRDIEFYNLDAIISVGYRVNSKQGTQFRIWATNKLKEYLVYGYAINQTRLEQTNQEVQVLRAGIQILGRVIEEKAQEEGLGWLTKFTKGLTLLDDFDHERLDSRGLSLEKAIYPTRQAYQVLINQMKLEFESDVFGLEKDQSFESAIAQVSKGFGKHDF